MSALGPMANELGKEPFLTLLRAKLPGLRAIERRHGIASKFPKELVGVLGENEEREAWGRAPS